MEKDKKSGRRLINAFDIGLILIALILGAVLIIKGRGSGSVPSIIDTSPDPEPIRYTLELLEAEDRLLDSFKVGDPIFDRATKYELGTVEDVEAVPYKRPVIDYENHRYVMAEVPDRYTVRITVASQALIESGSVIINGGYVLRVGTSISIKLPGIALYPTVVAIEKVEKE